MSDKHCKSDVIKSHPPVHIPTKSLFFSLPMSPLSLLLSYSILFGLSNLSQVDASIHAYRNQPFSRRSNSFFFHGGSEGLYASKFQAFQPNTTNEGDSNKPITGKSFIRFDSITFRRTMESVAKVNEMQQRTGLVEAILVDVKDREKIGGAYLNTSVICCTSNLSKAGHCKVGEVIIHEDHDNPNGPKRFQTFFEGKDKEAKMELQTVEINRTGMYYLYFMFCDPQLSGLLISGTTVWRNPNGYLPGKMTPLLTFFGFMSLAYLILGLVWFLQFVKHWKDMIQLHYHITAVIALGMCEMALWFYEYSNFNAYGERPMGITVWAVTFSALKKTVSRVLLLVVSMGYGVVKPTLGSITNRIVLLGVIYFVASEVLELFENLGNINDFSGKERIFLVLLVALLDSCFILWIFSSLSKTLEKLQIRRIMVKLELYRKFTNWLAVSVLLSIVWIGYELYYNANDPLSELWQSAWIIPAFWTLLAYMLLVVICVLWAPSHNPTRFAFSEETWDDQEEESVLITSSAVKIAAELGAKLERKDRRQSVGGEHHVLGLGEDLMEDKRA